MALLARSAGPPFSPEIRSTVATISGVSESRDLGVRSKTAQKWSDRSDPRCPDFMDFGCFDVPKRRVLKSPQIGQIQGSAHFGGPKMRPFEALNVTPFRGLGTSPP